MSNGAETESPADIQVQIVRLAYVLGFAAGRAQAAAEELGRRDAGRVAS